MKILNFSEFSMNEKNERPVDLYGVNFQLNRFYRDANGNSTASFTTYDGETSFKIQTNGNLQRTHKLVNTKLEDLSDDELRTIGEEAYDYIQNSSNKAKSKIKKV